MISGNEWIWVALVVLVLFGGSQIPKFARSIGQAQKEFKQGLSEGSASATLDEEASPPDADGSAAATKDDKGPDAGS